ncbi:MAG: DUF4922 domain-containing protein [Gammaproteobacteria bacterium]
MTRGRASIETDVLWKRAKTLRNAGIVDGAVTVFPHRTETLCADGITWVLRILTGKAPQAATEPDPFLPPYDKRLLVAELGPRHALLLNKYPVLDEHLLIVTRAALPQGALPEPEDFGAAATLLAGAPALAFYNGGPESGASQPHRHFQAVALPLGPASEPVPTAAWIERAATGARLPFPGAATMLDPALWDCETPDKALHDTAARLLSRSGRDPNTPGSFNLLFTREWMLAVPRRSRKFQGVSVNALGYAGALIARSAGGRHTLGALGPLTILRGAAGRAKTD